MGPYDTEGMPPEEAAPAQPGDESEPVDTDKDEAGPEGVTALLPKSICAGMDVQPGQTLTLKVVKTYDDEIEVEYVKGDEPSEMDQSESKLNDLAEAPPE
jgi:hypothetical protein